MNYVYIAIGMVIAIVALKLMGQFGGRVSRWPCKIGIHVWVDDFIHMPWQTPREQHCSVCQKKREKHVAWTE